MNATDIWALGAILRHVLTLRNGARRDVDEVMETCAPAGSRRIPPRAAHCPGGRVPEALTAGHGEGAGVEPRGSLRVGGAVSR
jgi:hypothetical protein